MSPEKRRNIWILAIGIGVSMVEIFGAGSSKSFLLGSDALHEIVDSAFNIVYLIGKERDRDHADDERRVRFRKSFMRVLKFLFGLAAALTIIGGISELWLDALKPDGAGIILWGMVGVLGNGIQILIHDRSPLKGRDEHFHIMKSHLRWDMALSAAVSACGGLMLVTKIDKIDSLATIAIGVYMLWELLFHSHDEDKPCSGHSHGN